LARVSEGIASTFEVPLRNDADSPRSGVQEKHGVAEFIAGRFENALVAGK
jgi:hypothetical protein